MPFLKEDLFVCITIQYSTIQQTEYDESFTFIPYKCRVCFDRLMLLFFFSHFGEIVTKTYIFQISSVVYVLGDKYQEENEEKEICELWNSEYSSSSKVLYHWYCVLISAPLHLLYLKNKLIKFLILISHQLIEA